MKRNSVKSKSVGIQRVTAESSENRGIATTFWIQAEDLKRLKQFANEHQLSASNVINRALRRFLSEDNPFLRR